MPRPSNVFIATSWREETRRLLQLAAPIAGAQLAMMMMGFVDTIMLRFIGYSGLFADYTESPPRIRKLELVE